MKVAAEQAAVGTIESIYGKRQPLKNVWNPVATLLFVLYCCSLLFYVAVRIMFTLDYEWKIYSIIILVVELIGASSVIPYALLNCRHTRPTGSKGLPSGNAQLPAQPTFNVRVLLCCYKEPAEVVNGTVQAIMSAQLPPGVSRVVYVCDDGKDAPGCRHLDDKCSCVRARKNFMENFYGPDAPIVHVTGRPRKEFEVNGKSENLNNCLCNVIYKHYLRESAPIPSNEVVVVFDADMRPKPNFFLKILEVMVDEGTSLCLTPQSFSNVNRGTDIYNNSNEQFWEYMLPGLNAAGYIACTGTNFCIRANALQKVGWFPTRTITEDYTLGMELKAAGLRGAYLAEYLAVGEAPSQLGGSLRALFRQRSRWCKGHWQVFCTPNMCPLIRWRLPIFQRWLYTVGTWSYFCCFLSSWVFVLVPFLSVMFGMLPVKFTWEFALAITCYLGANTLVLNYTRNPAHLRGLWMANIANSLLSYTYFKALLRILLWHPFFLKPAPGFKATNQGKAPAPAPGRFASATTTLMRSVGFSPAPLPEAPEPERQDADEVAKEKLFQGLWLFVSLVTIIMTLSQVYFTRTMTAALALPLLWALYNAVPPILFWTNLLASTGGLQFTCFWMFLLQNLAGLGAIIMVWFIPIAGPHWFTQGPHF